MKTSTFLPFALSVLAGLGSVWFLEEREMIGAGLLVLCLVMWDTGKVKRFNEQREQERVDAEALRDMKVALRQSGLKARRMK